MRFRVKAPTPNQLLKEMQTYLPLTAYVTPELSQALQQEGKSMPAGQPVQVSSVMDSGDMGGILCALESADQKEVFMISLTHLRIPADHQLRLRIEAYQKARVRQLRRQR